MAYYVDLFSPETYEAFTRSSRQLSGFRRSQQNVAERIRPGDKFICYMTKLSRWVGVLEVVRGPFEDDTPIFYEENDPFTLRFEVRPVVWLDKELSIPIREDSLWESLSFTRGHEKNSSDWTGPIRGSLRQLLEKDGRTLEEALLEQQRLKEPYPINEREYRKLMTHRVRRVDKVVTVSVPQDEENEEAFPSVTQTEVRESIIIQALLSRIGATMGLRIWLPSHDRKAVLSEWQDEEKALADVLPLNYDETTLSTIEQIDVLWLRGRSIVRAFEVEHTTSIYSGILRMADLLALQPNMDIKLHIVAPDSRRDKVFEELKRPVFSLLEKGPLTESCTYISYDSLRDLSKLKHLNRMKDDVLDDYSEEAE